jgi:hypothetical protein
VSKIVPRSVSPAALTRMSSRPKACSAAGTISADGVEIGEIGGVEEGLAAGRAEARGDSFSSLAIAAGEDETGGAASGELAGDRFAQPLAAAGDDGDLAVEFAAEIGWLRHPAFSPAAPLS